MNPTSKGAVYLTCGVEKPERLQDPIHCRFQCLHWAQNLRPRAAHLRYVLYRHPNDEYACYP